MGEDHVIYTQLESSSESSNGSSNSSIVSSDYEYSVCGEPGGNWIECESCEKWYHLHCVGIQANIDIKTLVWTCPDSKLINCYLLCKSAIMMILNTTSSYMEKIYINWTTHALVLKVVPQSNNWG